MIEIRNLTKNFGKIAAVSDISLTIRDQQIFGILGANGSGKTTLLRLIADVLRPDSGWIHLDGQEIADHIEEKREIFYAPDDLYFFPGASAEEMASYYARYYPRFDMEFFHRVSERFLLNRSRSMDSCPKGLQHLVAILTGLASGAHVLLLDETFDGLDPVMGREACTLLKSGVENRGLTVILTAHNLNELRAICSPIAFLHDGRILVSGSSEKKEDFWKVQCVFQNPSDRLRVEDSLSIRRHDTWGRLELYIVRGSREKIEESFSGVPTVYREILPLTPEERLSETFRVTGEEHHAEAHP